MFLFFSVVKGRANHSGFVVVTIELYKCVNQIVIKLCVVHCCVGLELLNINSGLRPIYKWKEQFSMHYQVYEGKPLILNTYENSRAFKIQGSIENSIYEKERILLCFMTF